MKGRLQAFFCYFAIIKLSFLQSTTTQITISVNKFFSNIIQFQISFLIKMHVKVLTKVFYIQICFKYETPLFFFLKYFITFCSHMTPHAI